MFVSQRDYWLCNKKRILIKKELVKTRKELAKTKKKRDTLMLSAAENKRKREAEQFVMNLSC